MKTRKRTTPITLEEFGFDFDSNTPEIEQEIQDDSISTVMEKPFNPKDIDITTKPMSLDNIIKRLRENEIDLAPAFQRASNLWDSQKQSQLIESILINFPLPAFYFDGSDNNKWLVVDGLQRLSTLNNFVVKNEQKLTGLEFLEKLEGLTFNQLPRTFQRQIEEANIIAYIINPGTPEEVKYNIFKRINTGGLMLAPQEIRHALNQGIPAEFINELAEVEEFKSVTQNVIPSKRMLDKEFITRFVAFYLNNPNDYKPDLDTFLNRSMYSIKSTTIQERINIKNNFIEAMTLAQDIFGIWAFRKIFNKKDRRKPINKALFEIWSVSLAKLSNDEKDIARKHKETILKEFIKLMNSDEQLVTAITSSTSDKNRVAYRFTTIETLLAKIIKP